jgi:TRAP-type C4-dicarboxylate transport system permease small subunit
MGALLRVVDFVDDVVGRLCRGVVFTTMLALLGVIGVNVVARYLFEKGGVNAVGEIPELLFPWLIGAGIVLAVQRGAHISLDFISGRVGPKGRITLLVLVNAIVIATYAALLGPVLQIADITSIEQTPLLRLPRSIGFYSIAATIIGVIIATVAITLRVLARGASAAPEFDPEESVT